MERSAIWGGAAWLAVSGLGVAHGRIWLIEILFLLAPLVLVPLALARIGPLPRALRASLPAAATCAAGSFFLPRGVAAAGLASAWLGATALMACLGLAPLRARGLRNASEVAIDAGLLLVPVGGVWLVLSRLGATPLGFEEPIVLLTAVHFHFAAFMTPILVGLAGRELVAGLLYRCVVAGTIAGSPLLAAGITLSPGLELFAAALLALSLWAFAGLLLARLRLAARPGRALLAVSALALLPSMAFALAYAWGEYTGQPLVALSWVVRIHGTLNALGFGLCGLAGWTLAARNHRPLSL